MTKFRNMVTVEASLINESCMSGCCNLKVYLQGGLSPVKPQTTLLMDCSER